MRQIGVAIYEVIAGLNYSIEQAKAIFALGGDGDSESVVGMPYTHHPGTSCPSTRALCAACSQLLLSELLALPLLRDLSLSPHTLSTITRGVSIPWEGMEVVNQL